MNPASMPRAESGAEIRERFVVEDVLREDGRVLFAIEAAAGGADLAVWVHEGTIQGASICQVEGHFRAALMERDEIHLPVWCEAPFDLEMRGHRFALSV